MKDTFKNNNAALTKTCSAFSSFFIKAFLILFCVVFTIIFVSVVFFNNEYKLSPLILLLIIAFNMTVMLVIYRILYKHVSSVERYYKLIVASGLIVLFVVNLIMGRVLRFIPIFDLGAVFTGAKNWAATGNFIEHMNPTCYKNYFYYFPNNLGGMAFLFLAFKTASLCGAVDYFAIATTANALLIAATVLLTVLICKRLFGITQSIMALIFVLISPPLYMIATVFYTDSLSIIFPVLVVYLYLTYINSNNKTKKILLACIIGLCSALGMLIKFTVVIALIAVVIHHIFTKGIVWSIPIAALSVTVIAVVFTLFNSYFYSAHLDKAKAEKLNIPHSHWVMMGLGGNGRYNGHDLEFTLSFENKEEQRAAINNRIKRRISSRGFLGIMSLFFNKGIIIFGDGTYALSDFLDDNPINDTSLHSFVLYEGEHYKIYSYACSGTYFSILFFILASSYGALIRKRCAKVNMLPLLCVFGIMLFLMMWEVTGRYVVNFIPLIFVSAASGIHFIINLLYKYTK